MGVSAAGFTGTRAGLTCRQRGSLYLLLERARPLVLHHGDCKGADAVAHELAGRLRIPRAVHPPDRDAHRAFCGLDSGLDWLPASPLPYLERDRRIVEETRWLIACPKQQPLDATRTGGTWYTVGYAQRKGRMVVLIWPDGTIEIDRWRDAR